MCKLLFTKNLFLYSARISYQIDTRLEAFIFSMRRLNKKTFSCHLKHQSLEAIFSLSYFCLRFFSLFFHCESMENWTNFRIVLSFSFSPLFTFIVQDHRVLIYKLFLYRIPHRWFFFQIEVCEISETFFEEFPAVCWHMLFLCFFIGFQINRKVRKQEIKSLSS